MTRGLSLYLDTLRFAAALVVLLSHWAYPRFTGTDHLWIRELNLGSDAVVVFFVLSGLVIAYAADRKDRSGGQFLFNRATRLYSVVLPALLLTFLVDRAGAALFPQAYEGWWYNDVPAPLFFLAGLSFANEWGIWGLRLGTNGPFWSLSYEVAYYALFAAAFYLRGVTRILALFCLVLLVGYKPLLLLPAWLLGVAVWRTIARPEFRLGPAAAWVFALLPLGLYGLALAADVPQTLLAMTAEGMGLAEDKARGLLRFSDEVLWNNLLAALVAVNFVGVAALSRQGAGLAVPERLRRALVWGAGGSFSLYLVHYPLLQFFGSALNGLREVPGHDLVLLGLVFALSMVFAGLFERRLKAVRSAARAVAARLSPRGGQVPRQQGAPAGRQDPVAGR